MKARQAAQSVMDPTDSRMTSVVSKKKQRKPRVRGNPFDDTETHHLLSIWASEHIQRSFKIHKHSLVYARITKLHCESEIYNRSELEIQNKIKNLKSQYRAAKPKSGASPPSWPFYACMHEVLGQQDSNRDDLIEDSFAPEFSQVQDSDGEDFQGSATNDDDDFDQELNEEEESQEVDDEKFSKFKLKKIKRSSSKSQANNQIIEQLLKSNEETDRRLQVLYERNQEDTLIDRFIAEKQINYLTLASQLVKETMKEKNYEIPVLMDNTSSIDIQGILKNCSRKNQIPAFSSQNSPVSSQDLDTSTSPEFGMTLPKKVFVPKKQLFSSKNSPISSQNSKSTLQNFDMTPTKVFAPTKSRQNSPRSSQNVDSPISNEFDMGTPRKAVAPKKLNSTNRNFANIKKEIENNNHTRNSNKENIVANHSNSNDSSNDAITAPRKRKFVPKVLSDIAIHRKYRIIDENTVIDVASRNSLDEKSVPEKKSTDEYADQLRDENTFKDYSELNLTLKEEKKVAEKESVEEYTNELVDNDTFMASPKSDLSTSSPLKNNPTEIDDEYVHLNQSTDTSAFMSILDESDSEDGEIIMKNPIDFRKQHYKKKFLDSSYF